MADVATVAKTKMKREGLALVTPLSTEVKALQVKTADDYLEADGLLGRVRHARAKWEAKMEPIIRPIRQGLDALYALNREVDGPLEAMEKGIKEEMKGYKLLEAKQAREAEAERERERVRIQAELDRKAAAEVKAKTVPMREKLKAAREALEDQLDTVKEVAPPVKVKAASSVGRKVKKWRVTSVDDVLAGVQDRTIPAHIVQIYDAAVTAQFKMDPEVVASWPGFEVYDDIEIAGR